jgi:hypothetical protein
VARRAVELGRVAAEPPWAVPALLVVAQWGAVAGFALGVEHNGWFYFQGGDQLWHYTSAWLLSEGSLPPSVVGYVWPFVLAPIAVFAGPVLLAGLPAIVLFQLLILLPAAVICIYSIGTALGGRLFGALAGGAWIVLPYAAVPLFDPRYHERYADQLLPQALGLTAMSDFPSMVALLVAAALAFRIFEAPSPRLAEALAAGAATGLAVGLKPANLMFVPGLLVGLAVARRWREAALALAALAPALVVLVVWKKLGLGEVPAFVETEAVRPGAPRIPVADRYLDLDWAQLERNEDYIREFFWSVRLLEWAALAGFVAVARRSRPAAAFLALWFAVFLVGKGTSHLANVQLGSFFRLLMPAFPAFFLLAVAVPLLAPRLGAVLVRRGRREQRRRSSRGAWLLAAMILVVTVAPLPVILAAEPLARQEALVPAGTNTFVPVLESLDLRAVPRRNGTLLSWPRPDAPGVTSFRVMRAQRGASLLCPKTTGAPTPWCSLPMRATANLRGTSFLATDPPEEGWVYRVGLVANASGDPLGGDVILLSPEADPLRP